MRSIHVQIRRLRRAPESFRPTALLVNVACVLAALSILAPPAMAQTSQSSAYILDYYKTGFRFPCYDSPAAAAGGSAANCPTTPVAGGTGSASTISNNGSRTASASASLTQTGAYNSVSTQVTASSYQYSAINLTGTPASTDNLLFRFLTPVLQGTGALGNTGSNADWQLLLSAGSGETEEYKFTYGDGTSSSTLFSTSSQATAQAATGGVDFTIPFSYFGNASTLAYSFEAAAQAQSLSNQPSGTSLGASITATLVGVDAVDAQGQRIASTSFNTDGTGSLDLTTSTVPEPGSTLLFGTGLVGLSPLLRRRRRSITR